MVLAGLMIAVIALLDWRVDAPIAFGFLYLFPILFVGSSSSDGRSSHRGGLYRAVRFVRPVRLYALAFRCPGHSGFFFVDGHRTVRVLKLLAAASGNR